MDGKSLSVSFSAVGDVVQGNDHLARGVGGQIVVVHQTDLRSLAVAHRRRQLLEVLRPGDHSHADRDVGVLSVELLDHLPHDRPVSAGQPVPKGQLDGRPVVALGAAAALDRGLLTRSACGTGRAGAQAGNSGEAQGAGEQASAGDRSGGERIGFRVVGHGGHHSPSGRLTSCARSKWVRGAFQLEGGPGQSWQVQPEAPAVEGDTAQRARDQRVVAVAVGDGRISSLR